MTYCLIIFAGPTQEMVSSPAFIECLVEGSGELLAIRTVHWIFLSPVILTTVPSSVEASTVTLRMTG